MPPAYIPPKLICEFCDNEFVATRKGQKYCCAKCRSLKHWHDANPDSQFYSHRRDEQHRKRLRQEGQLE